MKRLIHRLAGRRTFGLGAPLTVTLLLAAGTARAQTPYEGSGWIIGVPVPGIWCTNAQGQVGMRGNAHLVRVQCSDPRVTGRRTVFVTGDAQADGSSLIYGAAYQEVGSWDLADPANPMFTPTGGMWETTYRGTMQADGSLDLHIVGSGWGGAIDGLRVDETLARAPGPILDPTILYSYTGTIKPPPLSTNLVLDDFSGTATSGTCYPGWLCFGPPTHTYARTDGQLMVTGHWPSVITREVPDTYTFGGTYVWTVADDQTLEVRVDLANLGASATAARLVLATASESGFYSFFKGHDFMALSKWSALFPDPDGPVIMFFYEQAQVPDTDVVLSLALTKVMTNVIVTARVWDKANPDTVLFERCVVDTPGIDPALTSAQLLALSGMNLALCPDLTEAPITGGAALIGVWQYNYDGLQPPAVATFDNFEVRKYEVPAMGIAPAIRLSWLAPAGVNWTVQGAPTVLGPWLPVEDLTMPGIQQMTVPMGGPAQFFRLIQAP